jgi:hypothetical protein
MIDKVLSLKIKLLKDCGIEIDYDSFKAFNRGKYGGTAWSTKLIDGINVISEISLTECLLGKNRLTKHYINDVIEIRVEDVFGKKTGFHVELKNTENGIVPEYRVSEGFENDVEYRLLTRDGTCWVCHRNIKAKSEPVITFDSHKSGARTVIICSKCVEQMDKLVVE